MRIADAAARAGVPFVDAGAHIQVSGIDGIHYSKATHRILGQVLAEGSQNTFREWINAQGT